MFYICHITKSLFIEEETHSERSGHLFKVTQLESIGVIDLPDAKSYALTPQDLHDPPGGTGSLLTLRTRCADDSIKSQGVTSDLPVHP